MAIAKISLENTSFNQTNTPMLTLEVHDTFFKRLKGLMFEKHILPEQGALFVNKRISVVDSSIHMLFMNFDLAVFWLDQNNYVVDKILAKKWHPFYAPKKPAKIIIESHYNIFDKINIGDCLKIEIS